MKPLEARRRHLDLRSSSFDQVSSHCLWETKPSNVFRDNMSVTRSLNRRARSSSQSLLVHVRRFHAVALRDHLMDWSEDKGRVPTKD